MAIHEPVPFIVKPEECVVTYSCEEPLYNLCDMQNDLTETTFDPLTGKYSFESTDITFYGSQNITITINGETAQSTDSFSFVINLIEPCATATIEIDADIIENQIYHAVYSNNTATVIPLNPYYVKLSTTTDLCPAFKLDIVNKDGSHLDSALFSYNKASDEFICDTRDAASVGTYELKVVASFTSDIYTQSSDFPFTVILTDFTDRPYLDYDAL